MLSPPRQGLRTLILTMYTYIPRYTFTYARTYICMQVGEGRGYACRLQEAK
jgi:hypothetical protein